jgi:hypothetical protein
MYQRRSEDTAQSVKNTLYKKSPYTRLEKEEVQP